MYAILTPAALRSRYVTLTDGLIHTMEGHNGWVPDVMVALDKSGRPVAWLVKALWPVLARRPGTPFADHLVPPLPALRMVNIDREQWWDLTGASEAGVVEVGRVPAGMIRVLRGVFQPPAALPEAGTWLDGKRVLVVDEVFNTGDTLRIAVGLFQRAFPAAEVRGEHWMVPGTSVDRAGNRRTAEVPVWYRSDTWAGRLVGNRMDPANQSVSGRNKQGALFLSTRPRRPDLQGRRLRAEIAQVAHDVADGRLLARPAASRGRDDIRARIETLFGYSDPREFTAERQTRDHDS